MATEDISRVSAPAGLLPAGGNEVPLPGSAQRAMTLGLLISALRCTVQYVLLPFVLPWVGLAAAIPRWITILLAGVALASLTRNARYLWRVHHPRRWSYLVLASIVASVLLLFVALDLKGIVGA